MSGVRTLGSNILPAMVAAALLAVSPAALAQVVASASVGDIVKTSLGPVQGEAERGVDVFRGLYFAQAPTGALRFKPPTPVQPWTEVRPALDFAPACPQLVEIDPTENNNSVQSEDCLALNVWTPKPDGKRRPVMVWIHGGAFIDGSARNSWYDGARLAARGDIVVVTLQYRMGAFGFLDLSQVGGDAFADSGNLGLLDQVAALKWVRSNIGAFGGDPKNVTVFGESAGAASVALLLTNPNAQGLFDKAIIESMPPVFGAPRAQSQAVARAFMKVAGVGDVAGLQAMRMEDLRDAQQKLFETQVEDAAFGPTTDGRTIRENAIGLLQHGGGAPVPVLIGTTLDETQYWDTVEDLGQARKPRELLDKQLDEAFGLRAPTIKRAYFDQSQEPYGRDVIALTTDLNFRIPSIRLAEAVTSRQPVWMYLLTFRSTSAYKPYLSAHSMELPFVFGNVDDLDALAFIGRDPDRGRISTEIQDAWIAFAKTGDPNAKGLPDWPRYTPKSRATMAFGKVTEIVADPLSGRRQAWDGLAFDGVSPPQPASGALMFDNGK